MSDFTRVSIDEIRILDEPRAWAELGFEVREQRVQVRGVLIRLAGRASGRGIAGWSLRGVSSAELDGLNTTVSHAAGREPAGAHPNGVIAIDHVVAFSPDLERTIASLRAAGLDLRRVREEPTPAGAPRQAFFRLGAEILELIELPEERVAGAGGRDAPARLWGLAFTVEDIERTVEGLGEHASEVRAAVQAGRRIATLRRSAGLSVPVALMTPREVGVT
jgi:catechol 2,3-dioxygenase-like lactoylglutathione lyase family enzyme